MSPALRIPGSPATRSMPGKFRRPLDRYLLCVLSLLTGWLCLTLVAAACGEDEGSVVSETTPPLTMDDAETPDLAEDSALLDRVYQGRTLRRWLIVLKNLDHQDPSAALQIPGLIEIMQDPELPWFTRRQAATTLGRIGEPASAALPLLREHLHSGDDETISWAAKAIALYGPVGVETVPELVAVLQDEHRSQGARLMAMEALARIGPRHPRVLPALIEQLQSPAATHEALERRIAACQALGLLRASASPALPYLIRTLTAESSRLRGAAATTIGLIGPEAQSAIDSLVDVVLFDKVPEVQDAAARALSDIGSSAIPALCTLLTDREPEIRERAAQELGRILTPDARTIDTLHRAAAGDESNRVRLHALQSLMQLSADPSLMIPAAIDLLAHEERQIRIGAYRLLLELRSEAETFRPRLEELARDERRHVREVATRLLQEISPQE